MANHRMLRFARIENIVKDYIMEERENERAVTARAIKENILMKKLLKEYSAKIQFYTEQGMASYEKLKATHLDFMRLMEKISRVVPLPGHSGNITPRDSKRPNTLEQGARNMADSGMGNLNPPPAKRRLARVSPMVQGVVLRQGRVRLNRLDVSNLDSGNRALIESISSQSSTPEDVNRNSEADQDSDDSQH